MSRSAVYPSPLGGELQSENQTSKDSGDGQPCHLWWGGCKQLGATLKITEDVSNNKFQWAKTTSLWVYSDPPYLHIHIFTYKKNHAIRKHMIYRPFVPGLEGSPHLLMFLFCGCCRAPGDDLEIELSSSPGIQCSLPPGRLAWHLQSAPRIQL